MKAPRKSSRGDWGETSVSEACRISKFWYQVLPKLRAVVSPEVEYVQSQVRRLLELGKLAALTDQSLVTGMQ
jgi:hypothetical protein